MMYVNYNCVYKVCKKTSAVVVSYLGELKGKTRFQTVTNPHQTWNTRTIEMKKHVSMEKQPGTCLTTAIFIIEDTLLTAIICK